MKTFSINLYIILFLLYLWTYLTATLFPIYSSVNIVSSRYLAIQGGFPGHGVPRRRRWVLWFGWLLGSPGLMWEKNKQRNEWRNKERKMPPFVSKWEVWPCWPYTWQEHFPIYLLQNTTCTYIHLYTRRKHTGWRGVTFSFIQRGTKPFWINPCLRALVPSPSWIGLDSFFLPSIMNEHNSKFPDSSLSLNLVWRRTLDSLRLYRKYFPPLPHAPCLFSLYCFTFFFFFFFYW